MVRQRNKTLAEVDDFLFLNGNRPELVHLASNIVFFKITIVRGGGEGRSVHDVRLALCSAARIPRRSEAEVRPNNSECRFFLLLLNLIRLERLHFSQRSSTFLAVLLPPLTRGTMWSYSRFSRLPHLEHCPPSLRHTSILTASGTRGRPGWLLSEPADLCLWCSRSKCLLSLSNSSTTRSFFPRCLVALYRIAVVLEKPASRKVKLNWIGLRPFEGLVDPRVETLWLVVLWSPRVEQGSVVYARDFAVDDRIATWGRARKGKRKDLTYCS